MSRFDDLAPYTYGHDYSNIRPDLPVVNIGWLQGDEKLSEGGIDLTLEDKLEFLTKHSIVNRYRGWHTCGFCKTGVINGRLDPNTTGNGEIRIVGKDKVYVAPQLVYHYIKAHGYQPPQEFVIAVKETPLGLKYE